jgi:hypothetical protein
MGVKLGFRRNRWPQDHAIGVILFRQTYRSLRLEGDTEEGFLADLEDLA